MAQIQGVPSSVQDIRALKNTPWAFKRLAERLINISVGRLKFLLPGGQSLVFAGEEDGPDAQLEILNYAVVGRIIRTGDVGLAEGFMAGEWNTPDLAALLTTISANLDRMHGLARGRSRLANLFHTILHSFNANTRAGSKRNIHKHYDLGNAFYAQWLDPSMTYSSARFDDQALSLEDAQRRKYQTMAKSLDLQPDDHVLEIGCGWGGFAEYAAREIGARVTGITISREQYDYAVQRMQRLQLSDKVDLRFVDYRDVEGQYDKVASIEMFEAVGQEFWPEYFNKISKVLKPGGKAALQIITIRDDLFSHYSGGVDFIQRYIFPGGVLPSLRHLREEIEQAGMRLEQNQMFGLDYAATLSKWMQNFNGAWQDIKPLGFDERFHRLWQFYLAYCEAGFRTGRTDVGQFVLHK